MCEAGYTTHLFDYHEKKKNNKLNVYLRERSTNGTEHTKHELNKTKNNISTGTGAVGDRLAFASAPFLHDKTTTYLDLTITGANHNLHKRKSTQNKHEDEVN